MRSVIASLIVLVSSTCFAVDSLTKYDIRWVEATLPKVREILAQNIQACNAEDINALMKTLHPALPRRGEFRAEAEQLFKDTDLYTRIIAVEYSPHRTETNHLGVEFCVYVTQHTVIANGSDEDRTFFRERSALLPPEYCKYLMGFWPDGRGGWKCGKIYGRLIEIPEGNLDLVVDGIPDWFIREHGGGRRAVAQAAPGGVQCVNDNCRKSVRAANSAFQ
jgi:hypothetical protein